MANRVPLILNTSSNQIQELPTGDNLDLSNSGIHNAGVITATTFNGSFTGTFSGDGSNLSNLSLAQATVGYANSSGISTVAQGLTGSPDITVGAISAQNISIGGTLTYEDVTNVDSVGVITARSGVNVTDGNVFIGQGGSGANNAELKLQAGAGTGNDIIAFLNQAGSTRGNLTYDTDNNFLLFNVNASERLRIKSDGALNLTTSNASLEWTASSGSNPFIRSIGSGQQSLEFNTGGSERLRITSGGQLIAGSTSADTSALISIIKDTTEVLADNEPLYNNASPAFLTVYNSNNTGSGEEAGINIVPAGSANGAISIYGKKTGSYAGDLIFRFRSGASTSAERLRITSDGKIGVGIASPVGTFEIRDSKANLIVAKDGLTAISNSDAHTTYDLIQLGAGGGLASYSTATATADTHLVHNAYRHSGGSWKYKYADTAMRLRMNSPGGAFIFDSAASGSAGATISFSEKLRITSDGYVGINNNSPATVLDIKSTKASDGLTVTKGSNVAAFLGHNGTGDEGLLHLKDGGTVTTQIYGETGQASFFNAGNVGFGSVTPASDVDVCGSAPEIRITNTATSRAYLSWYNHYGGVNKNANISYNEGSANWEFKLYRADSQANSPYGNIQFFTGSTSSPTLAMNITRPGSVTMPKQPCCVMTATSATTWSSGWTKIPVNSSYFDVGNNFDSGNNRYSIPVSGKYAIGFNVEMNIGNGQTWIYFVPRINRNDTTSKNAGINYADFAPMSNNSSNHYYCHNGHWIANLTQGDTVTFEMHGAGNAWTVAANNQSHYYIYQVA